MERIFETKFEQIDKVKFINTDDKNLDYLTHVSDIKYNRIFMFIDKNLKNVWGEKILANLQKTGKEIFIHEVEDSEDSKSIEYYPTAVKFLEDNLCNRYDLVIAAGGGIVIDLVSFTVSTYMRGLPLMVIASTLIGQTDASTAGKTCLNSSGSKNLLGTFYYPKVVYNNINLLKTNERRFLRQGYSEVFKYGLLGSKNLMDNLVTYLNEAKENDELLLDIICEAIEVRTKIRHNNPLASNLGHTFGHAIEKLTNYEVLHGDAIAVGTVFANNFAASVGLMDQDLVDDITAKMKSINLNIKMDKSISAKNLVKTMLRDKKSSHKELNLVLIKGIAHPYENDQGERFYRVDPKIVEDYMEKFLSDYDYVISDLGKSLESNEIEY